MSYDDHLRRQTQEQVRNNPHTQKLADHEADNHKRTVVNAEIERIRKEREADRR